MKTLAELITLYASANNSEATTARGQLKAALAYRRRQRRAPILAGLVALSERARKMQAHWEIPVAARPVYNLPVPLRVTAGTYALPKPLRTFSHEERAVRRAIHDKTFRTGWLRENAAEQKKLLRVGPTLADITHAIDLQVATAKRLKELVAFRTRVTGKTCPLPKLAFPGHTVPIAMPTARKFGYHGSMVGKDWAIYPTRGSSHLVMEEGHTDWQNGKPKDYTRATRDNFVRSFAVIRDPRTIDFAIHLTELRLVLPDGLQWGVDGNGLHAIDAQGDDYHPSAGELALIHKNPDYLLQKIATNRDARRRAKAEAAASRAELEGVQVCMADSLRGGNCRSGTEAWAQRHQISPDQHIPALKLLDLAGHDSPDRVRLAIAAATRRHRQEVARGFAVLSEHQVSA